MELCYDGALVLPSSYAVMDEEEMCYTEGGYVSRSVNWISYPIDIACTAIGLNASALWDVQELRLQSLRLRK